MWPTPKGSPDKYGGPRENDRGDLQAAVRLWPTPRTSDYKTVGPLGSPSQIDMEQRRYLNATVLRWPTPQARDYRSGEGHRWMTPEERSRNLTDAVAYSRDYKMTPESEPHPSGGQLNPTWVEWLMGFPTGWTDLGRSATPSSPRSRNGSVARSSRSTRNDD
jgi:hypothetical protein